MAFALLRISLSKARYKHKQSIIARYKFNGDDKVISILLLIYKFAKERDPKTSLNLRNRNI